MTCADCGRPVAPGNEWCAACVRASSLCRPCTLGTCEVHGTRAALEHAERELLTSRDVDAHDVALDAYRRALRGERTDR